MRPDIEHIEPLKNFSVEDFADWLSHGFKDWHSDGVMKAFAPLNYFVGRLGGLTNNLKDIYDVFSGSAQMNFRFGIAQAISDLPTVRQSVPIIRSFLHLAGRINAREIFPVIVKQDFSNFFKMLEHNEGQELFALTLGIVAGMSPHHSAGDVMRLLVDSRFFRYNYAPMAFIALCRAEPKEFPEHLRFLRRHFTKLHQKEGTNNAFITARRFVKYVDPAIIEDKLWQIDFKDDNWLVTAMTVNEFDKKS
ncbi:hypothetical protein KAJ61_04395 [Candidatus Parcubacteria bacterium]|nr:hypothetical protein [Candidatus Parcubacteria bacterium]